MPASRLQALRTDLARSCYRAAPRGGWVELVEEHVYAGATAHQSNAYWVDGSGTIHPITESDNRGGFDDLRSAMSDPERGKWASVRLEIQPTGRYRFAFGYLTPAGAPQVRPIGRVTALAALPTPDITPDQAPLEEGGPTEPDDASGA